MNNQLKHYPYLLKRVEHSRATDRYDELGLDTNRFSWAGDRTLFNGEILDDRDLKSYLNPKFSPLHG